MSDFFPPVPVSGSNAIGSFTIGVSPIETIEPFAWQNTVISQYANSAIILQLLENFNQYIDQTQNFDNFFDFIWNVDTAQGYGLDVWGRIVGVSRTLQVASATFLGWAQQVPTVDTWGFGIWFSGQDATNNFQLQDDAYRTLILAKALANICDGSIPAMNQLLLNLFPGRGNCYVVDNMDMTMIYKFKFILTPVEVAIVENSGVLPTPCGVSFTVEISP